MDFDTGADVLAPYTPSHARPAHRRARLLIYGALIAFCLMYGFSFALFAPFAIAIFAAPPVLLLLIAIWALPDSRTAPTGFLELGLFVFIAGLVMWPNYIAVAPPGVPWITMARITGFPLTLILLICVSTSATFRSGVATALRSTSYIWRLLVVFECLAAFSIALSEIKLLSVDKFILAQISWIAVFFASVFVFLRPGNVERMAAMLWIMAIFVGVMGIFEWRQSHVLWAGHIPSFLKIADDSVLRVLAGNQRFTVYRVISTFSSPLGLGEYMAIVIPFILQFTARTYMPVVRVAAAVSVVFVLFIAKISGSRLGLVGCLLALLFALGVWAVLKWRRERGGLLAPAVVFAYPIGFFLCLAAVAFVGRLRHLVWGNGSQGFSDNARAEQWALGIPKIISHPQGYGIGMGAHALGYAPFGFTTIDSYYLSVALEYGVLGFIIFYLMIGFSIYYCVTALLKASYKDRDIAFLAPAAIALTNFLLIKSVFSQQDNHPILFMILGLTVALVHRARVELADG